MSLLLLPVLFGAKTGVNKDEKSTEIYNLRKICLGHIQDAKFVLQYSVHLDISALSENKENDESFAFSDTP